MNNIFNESIDYSCFVWSPLVHYTGQSSLSKDFLIFLLPMSVSKLYFWQKKFTIDKKYIFQ